MIIEDATRRRKLVGGIERWMMDGGGEVVNEETLALLAFVDPQSICGSTPASL